MKKLIVFGLATLLAFLPAAALDFTYNGISYTILDDVAQTCQTTPGSYSVSSGNTVSGDIVIPEYVLNGTRRYKVTAVGNYSFQKNSDLTSITLPESVTYIGQYAFYRTGLTSVDLGGAVFLGYCCFRECMGLTQIELPNSVETLDGAVFQSCYNLKSITFGNSVKMVDTHTFSGCTSLAEVTAPDLESWCNIDFIGTEAFPLLHSHKLIINGEELTHLVVPSSITKIKNCTFYGLTTLKSVTFHDEVTSIGSGAFQMCGLTEVSIPSSVTKIGDCAFASSGIRDVYYDTNEPIVAPENAFVAEVYKNAVLHFPAKAADKFASTAPWNLFQNSNNQTAVNAIEAEDRYGEEFYNLQGIRMTGIECLPAGMYVVRAGTSIRKILVK